MAVKRLSQPFPTVIFPEPDGLIDAYDRAALAVGYPLLASVPAPPAPPPVAPPVAVPMRVPSIRIAPVVYWYIFQVWVERWRFAGPDVHQSGREARGAFQGSFRAWMVALERLRVSEVVLGTESRTGMEVAEVFKTKDVFNGLWRSNLITEEGTHWGARRMFIVSEACLLLGIEDDSLMVRKE